MALGPAGRYKEKQEGATTISVVPIGASAVCISGLWLRLDLNFSLKKLTGRPSNLAGIIVCVCAKTLFPGSSLEVEVGVAFFVTSMPGNV